MEFKVFKFGDLVRVHLLRDNSIYEFKGVVHLIYEDRVVKVEDLSDGEKYLVHPIQCTKIKVKPKIFNNYSMDDRVKVFNKQGHYAGTGVITGIIYIGKDRYYNVKSKDGLVILQENLSALHLRRIKE